MWWLYYLVGIAVLVAAWWLIREWLRRRPARPVDEDELQKRAAAAEARQRRDQDHARGDNLGPGPGG
jgi:hypothetical protein